MRHARDSSFHFYDLRLAEFDHALQSSRDPLKLLECGRQAERLDKDDVARSLYEKCSVQASQQGEKRALAWCNLQLAHLLLVSIPDGCADPDAVRQGYLERARHLFEEIGDKVGQAYSDLETARLELEAERSMLLSRALEIATIHQDLTLKVRCLSSLAVDCACKGSGRSNAYFRAARAIADRLNDNRLKSTVAQSEAICGRTMPMKKRIRLFELAATGFWFAQDVASYARCLVALTIVLGRASAKAYRVDVLNEAICVFERTGNDFLRNACRSEITDTKLSDGE